MSCVELQGIFLDLYNDSVDSDETREYQHFPFYPFAVAETAYIKQLFEWCEQNNKILNLNMPESSMPVLHLCHSITADSCGNIQHWSLADRLVSNSAGKRHLLLPPLLEDDKVVADPSGMWLENANKSMWYGELPCPWQQPPAGCTWATPGWAALAQMAAANAPFANLLADAVTVGGDTSPWRREADCALLFHCNTTGKVPMAFVTISNQGAGNLPLALVSVRLDRYLRLPAGHAYNIMLWDGCASFTMLASGDGADLSTKVVELVLQAYEVKALAYVPAGASDGGRLLGNGDKDGSADGAGALVAGRAMATVGVSIAVVMAVLALVLALAQPCALE